MFLWIVFSKLNNEQSRPNNGHSLESTKVVGRLIKTARRWPWKLESAEFVTTDQRKGGGQHHVTCVQREWVVLGSTFIHFFKSII